MMGVASGRPTLIRLLSATARLVSDVFKTATRLAVPAYATTPVTTKMMPSIWSEKLYNDSCSVATRRMFVRAVVERTSTATGSRSRQAGAG